MASELTIYRFDRFTLDLRRGALVAEDGSELSLRPKSFALLRHMVMHAGRLMDRDELMQAVWPDVFVTDDSISQCVKEIRRALGDQAQRVLRTVPRRGYLIDVSTTCMAADEPLTASSAPVTTNADLSQTVPAPAANRPMVVVLPFENIGDDPEQRYLAEGLAVDLVTDLSHFQELCVVSPAGHGPPSLAGGSSSSSWPIPEAANYVFAGTMRRTDRQIRITTRLEDAPSGVVLWAERYDRPLDELFALQEELAQRLPGHLVSQIKWETSRRIRRRPTTSLDAYDLCLRGRDLHFRGTEKDTLAAYEMFARAIELDPDYATAHAWQAYTVQRGYTHLWGRLFGREAAIEALRLARRSVEIEPGASFALGTLALVLLLNASWVEALERGAAAVHANPCAPGARFLYGEVLTHTGHPVEAEREIRLALSLHPFHPPSWRAGLGRALFVAGRPEEALTELRFCAERMPEYGPCLHVLAAAAAETGRAEEARSAVRQLLHAHPGLTMRRVRDCLFFRDPAVVERLFVGFRVGDMPEG